MSMLQSTELGVEKIAHVPHIERLTTQINHIKIKFTTGRSLVPLIELERGKWVERKFGRT